MRATKISSGWIEVEPVVDMKMRALCVKPYYNHPNGCPNYVVKAGCPPTAPKIITMLDLTRSVFAIYNIFRFRDHCDRMRELHPAWSKRQIECCLYWQGSARKQLKEIIMRFQERNSSMIVITTPEAMGVNITETMARVGIYLEWSPINYTYQIALAGKVLPGVEFKSSLSFEDLI